MRRIKDNLSNPVVKLRKQKLEKLGKCYSELETYKTNKITLEYPSFFIPGWTGENCAAWKEPYLGVRKKYRKYYKPVMNWLEEIVTNKNNAHFIEFSYEESDRSESFLEMGQYLKKKILNIAGTQPINLIGHSMGGLDIRAALLDEKEPVLNAKNIITVGTPNNGTPEAGILGNALIKKIISKFKKFRPSQIIQGVNLSCSSEPMRYINTLENRVKLIERVEKFFILMGLKDFTVRISPKLDKDGIDENKYNEVVKVIQTSSAEHSGKNGITQDPRLLLPMVKILCGIEIKDDFNRGYIYRKDDNA